MSPHSKGASLSVRYDVAAAAAIARSPIPHGAKGWPPAAEGLPASEVAGSGWRLLNGDLPLPALILRERALDHNVALIQSYCNDANVRLAPHAKTTMAPQLFAKQLDAGAWGLTVATPAQLRICRRLRVQRIIYANQLVESGAIAWITAELNADPDFEFWCLVDSRAGVQLLDRELRRLGVERPLSVLVEIGMEHTRCGCRTADQARAVAADVAASSHLALHGIEGFEGLTDDIAQVVRFLNEIDSAYSLLEGEGLFVESVAPFISVGGSAYFDLVVHRLRHRRLILRSGCYVTHDDGEYARTSPLDGRATGEERLHNALELWSVVLSRPEPTLVIAGMGKRDSGFDRGYPTPRKAFTCGDTETRELDGRVVALSDQHAHIQVAPQERLEVGDFVCSTISHPCTTLDKWRVIPVVDETYQVTGALHTFF